MSRLIIDLEAMNHNLSVIERQMRQFGANCTIVTKVLCGHQDTIHALGKSGIRSLGDSRLENLEVIRNVFPECETWYLRPPVQSEVEGVIEWADVSLVTETKVIELLDEEARRRKKVHKIVIMIELGDLREGILPGHLVSFYKRVFNLPNIEVVGLGANLGCLTGVVPTVDQLMQLLLYHELLELKFERKIPFVSAGTTAVLPLMVENQLPKRINHFRIGEAVFLGTDLINGGLLPELRDDVMILEAEVAEIKEKSLVPLGETNSETSPFDMEVDDSHLPGQRGYRALINIGQLDTDVSGLTPLETRYQIAGASSDITVLNVGNRKNGVELGSKVSFKLSYSALLRCMNNKYIEKVCINSEKGHADTAQTVGSFVSETETLDGKMNRQ